MLHSLMKNKNLILDNKINPSPLPILPSGILQIIDYNATPNASLSLKGMLYNKIKAPPSQGSPYSYSSTPPNAK